MQVPVLTIKDHFNVLKFMFGGMLFVLSLTATSQIRIEAEDYDAIEGILTQQTLDAGGGLNVGWIDVGDWLSYKLAILVTGEYALGIR
ncbi:MAG: hypothetical protein ACI8QD_000479 [Cyclobacteriaceae bacterium]|jgi:hypothetical protein